MNGSHLQAGSQALNRGLRGLDFPEELPDWNFVPDLPPNHLSHKERQRRDSEEDSLANARQTPRESSEDEETLKQRSFSLYSVLLRNFMNYKIQAEILRNDKNTDVDDESKDLLAGLAHCPFSVPDFPHV